jgi:hypothetical protein
VGDDCHHRVRLIFDHASIIEAWFSQEWRDGNETASAFTAGFQGEDMQGMLREQHDNSNALAHVTLYLRPYRMLRPAIARMGEPLALSPLPGAGHRQAETGG